MKLTHMLATGAIALSLAAPALAADIPQMWTLEGRQVVTGAYSTAISDGFFIHAYASKKECIEGLKERISTPANGLLLVAPPCLPAPFQDPSEACSISSTQLTCVQNVYAVEE